MNFLECKLTDAATRLRQGASDAAGDLRAHLKDGWHSVQQRTGRAARESAAYVRENPVPISLAAFGCGFVLGLCLDRRALVSFKNRYIADPLHNSIGVLPGLLLACVTARGRSRSSANSAGEKIAERVGGDSPDLPQPLKSTARHSGRKPDR